MGFEPFEKLAVAYQGNLHGFGHACSLLARRQHVDECAVIDDRPGRRKGADQVLETEQIDGVLDADAAVILCQYRSRKTNVADATMKDRRRITDRIKDSAAADRNYKGVPIDRALRKDFKQVGNGFRIVLADFASPDRYKSDQVDASGVRSSVVFDLRSKIRKRCQDTFVNTNQTSVPLTGFSPGQRINQTTISKRKRIAGKDHRILIGDAERLQSNVFGALRGRIEHGILPRGALALVV